MYTRSNYYPRWYADVLFCSGCLVNRSSTWILKKIDTCVSLSFAACVCRSFANKFPVICSIFLIRIWKFVERAKLLREIVIKTLISRTFLATAMLLNLKKSCETLKILVAPVRWPDPGPVLVLTSKNDTTRLIQSNTKIRGILLRICRWQRLHAK